MDLSKFSFSGAFSFVPFFVTNTALAYLQCFAVIFAVTALLEIQIVRSFIATTLATAVLSVFVPLIIRMLLLGWLIADNTRIKHPRIFMLFDAAFSLTVGIVLGASQALLRMCLVMAWSVMRSTQLHARLLPPRLAALDAGYSAHGALLRCRYAADAPALTSAW